MCYAAAHFLFALCVEYNVRIYSPVHVFDSISLGLQLESSQVVNVLMVGPVQLFPFLWFFRWVCIFLLLVALCCGPVFSRIISWVLICNLWT